MANKFVEAVVLSRKVAEACEAILFLFRDEWEDIVAEYREAIEATAAEHKWTLFRAAMELALLADWEEERMTGLKIMAVGYDLDDTLETLTHDETTTANTTVAPEREEPESLTGLQG